MRFTEAIESMNRAYVPGCVQFYERFSPDPWQQANDELEAVLKKHGSLMDHPACAAWLERMLYLIARFKEFGVAATQISMTDAFNMGDEARVKEHQAAVGPSCTVCEHDDHPLRLERSSRTGRVAIVCSACVPIKAKSRRA